jgi:LysM repeat protein
MENLAKATPIIAIAALVCGLVGLILGIVAFQKSSQLDLVTEIKDANSTISESVASLQEEMSGLSKKYVSKAYVDDFAASTQGAFNQIADQLTKVRTQSRADTIKIAELESRLKGGGTVRSSTPSSSSSTSSASNVETTASSVPAGGVQYTIQSGDTLGRVATNFGISLDKLLSANPGVQPRYLRVGQTIVIPE